MLPKKKRIMCHMKIDCYDNSSGPCYNFFMHKIIRKFLKSYKFCQIWICRSNKWDCLLNLMVEKQSECFICCWYFVSGLRLGNLYCDPLMACSGHKITARQRWTPTPLQLQVLERIFDEGNGTPSKQKIKDITIELGQHGQISETNVYNWFQNRRARSKRKQLTPALNVVEPEVETEVEVESPKEKKTRAEGFQVQPYENSSPHRIKDMYIQSPDIGINLSVSLCLDKLLNEYL